MADKKKSDTSADDATSGGSKRMIVMVVLIAVIAGAGFVLGGRMTGGSATTEAVAPEPVEEPAEPTIDEIVELMPLNVNLADGHYLRLAVAIGISHHATEYAEDDAGDGYGDKSEDDDEPSIETAPASDLVLTTFAGRELATLATPEGREAARNDLHDGLVAFYGESIVAVLFTEFVMQ
jgi:flagellar protein FliL